ncbi:protein YfeA [Salmonella enterica subsp. enterica]|uniref:Protein YfeA n=1 Tax=Salmonella enterica I TaxID=59201 RepID=A0A447TYN7_SALET|nr:protein YfeA [Salmonella enterica subsp. enterica]
MSLLISPKEKRLFTLLWFATLATLLAVLCTPFETKYIAGYLVPVLFIGFTIGVGKISYPLLNFSLGSHCAIPA